MNNKGKYVLSYGIEFNEFLQVNSEKIPYALLLQHKFDHTHFNLHTRLEYTDREQLQILQMEDVYGFGDFCWLDFEEEASLEQLDGQEIAELLYMGHFKDHLHIPFYEKLNNQFVYLAHDDGWYNKIYYRSWTDFYHTLGVVISNKLRNMKGKSFFSFKKKKEIPQIPLEILQKLESYMKQGMVFSLEKPIKNRSQYEIPIWTLGDFYNMDEMYEEYELLQNRIPDGKLLFDRKNSEWQVFVN